jgi:3-deoxy-D-manno-octulosonic-acid transferase
MFILYDFIFLLISLFYLPIYFCRGKFHRGFLTRLGLLPRNLDLDRPIWIHAVSVGEAIMLRPLIEKLHSGFPERRLVISTVTTTGNKIARQLARKKDFVTYLPLDFSFIVRGVIDYLNPSLFIIAETELWPNLITYLYKKKIPLLIVNGRISDASFRGYRLIKLLLRPLVNKVTCFLVQAEQDAQRLRALGASEEKIQVSGNMKFDLVDYLQPDKDYSAYRQALGIFSQEQLVVAGSTHPGEESVLLSIYQSLKPEFAELQLLLAPRHPQRAKEVGRLVLRYGFRPLFISELGPAPSTQHPAPVFILDTVGQLLNYYAIADIVFIGGSLVKKGGHNILEPAIFARPILFGPQMFNFRDITELFLKNHAALLIPDKEEFCFKLKTLLNDRALGIRLGQAAQELVLKNKGATQRCLEALKTLSRYQ